MDADDFRRIALSLEGAEESSHMGQPDFRVGGRIFATLASAHQGYGNLMLTPEQQAAFVEELPEVFVPIAGGLPFSIPCVFEGPTGSQFKSATLRHCHKDFVNSPAGRFRVLRADSRPHGGT
jgi:hypothetical protein